MHIEIDNADHGPDFVRLNELWISEHFALEETDRKLAADPFRVVRDGGHILSLVEDGQVIGVCALFRETAQRYQLARMAVEPGQRGRGCGAALIRAAIGKARACGAETLYLLSNTVLGPAISLYRKHGFRTVTEGPHPEYARCNIVMELRLAPHGALRHRLAGPHDIDVLRDLMNAAISELQKPFLDAGQIESSRKIMGLDSQLIEDGTYYVVEIGESVAGCGGWSRRATLYGGDQSPGRSPDLLDPRRDAARVRAMYTHPAFARRGVGRRILELCETAARSAGFGRIELMATLAGEPLYRVSGYEVVERLVDDRGGAGVPLMRMQKVLLWNEPV